jgi:hypothetical protein
LVDQIQITSISLSNSFFTTKLKHKNQQSKIKKKKKKKETESKKKYLPRGIRLVEETANQKGLGFFFRGVTCPKRSAFDFCGYSKSESERH